MLRSALGALIAACCGGCFMLPQPVPEDDESAQTSGFAEPAASDWARDSDDASDEDADAEGGGTAGADGDEDDREDDTAGTQSDDDDGAGTGTDGGDDDDASGADSGSGGGADDDGDDESSDGDESTDDDAGEETSGGAETGAETSGGTSGDGDDDDAGGSSGGSEEGSDSGGAPTYAAACLLFSAEPCEPSCRGWETTSLDEHEAESELCFAAAGVLVDDVPCWSPEIGVCTIEAPEITVELTYDGGSLACTADTLEAQCESDDGGTWTPT